jgi:serine/threonine protein kinase
MDNKPYILAGQGTSSCTFAPEDIHLGNTIVQLKRKRTAQQNIERIDTLGLPGINEGREKLLYPYKNIEDVPAEFPKGKCKLKGEKTNPLKTVKIPYGGKDLSKLAVTQKDIFDFFTAFKNIFDGLLKLHQTNIAHLDVKPANMVGEKEGDTYKLRLIDFGLSKKTDERLDNSEFYKYEYIDKKLEYVDPINYPFWSYDLRLLNNDIFTQFYLKKIETKEKLEREEIIVRDIHEFNYDFSQYKYPTILIKKITPDLVGILLQKINNDNKAEILLKSDVFSLGLSLYIIWKRVTGYGLDNGGNLTYYLECEIDKAMVHDEAMHYIIEKYPDKDIPEGWGMKLSRTLRKTGNHTGKNLIYFYNTKTNLSFWDIKKIETYDAEIEASEKVFELVKKMCNPDPFSRLTLEDALTEYTLVVLPFIQTAYPHVGEIEPVTPPGSPPPTPPGSPPPTPPPGSPPEKLNKGGSRRKNRRNNKKYVKSKKTRTRPKRK